MCRILNFSEAARVKIGERNLELLTIATKQLIQGSNHHIGAEYLNLNI